MVLKVSSLKAIWNESDDGERVVFTTYSYGSSALTAVAITALCEKKASVPLRLAIFFVSTVLAGVLIYALVREIRGVAKRVLEKETHPSSQQFPLLKTDA